MRLPLSRCLLSAQALLRPPLPVTRKVFSAAPVPPASENREPCLKVQHCALPLLFINPTALGEWLTYKTQRFLIAPFLPKLLGLATLFVSLSVAGGFAYAMVSRMNVRRSTYKAFTLLSNIPGGSAVDEESNVALAVTNLLYMMGLLTFSVFIGIVGNEIGSRVDDVKKGNWRIADSGHIVILNYNEQTIPILRQMAVAKREGRLRRDKPVIVLADKSKEDMDREVALGLSGEYEKCGLTVLTRSGRPSRVEDLDLVSAGKAGRCILLRPGNDVLEGVNDDMEDTHARLLIQCTALHSVQRPPLPKSSPPRLAEVLLRPRAAPPPVTLLHLPESMTGGEGGQGRDGLMASIRRGGPAPIYSVPERGYVARLIGQCFIQPGVSTVHTDLLTQGVGTVEFYFKSAARFPSLKGATYGEAQARFPRAVLCGVRRAAAAADPGASGASASSGGLMFNPSKTLQLLPTDSLLFLADSKASIRAQRQALRAARHSSAVAAAAGPDAVIQPPHWQAIGGEQRVTILNWNPGTSSLLHELDEAAARFSKVRATVLVKPAFAPSLQRHLKELQLRNMKVEVQVGQPVSKKALRGAGVTRADAIIMLQDRPEYLFTREDIEAEEEEMSQVSKDSQALATLVLVQDLLTEQAQERARGNHGNSNGAAVSAPQLIAETHTPRAMELARRIASELPPSCGWAWRAVDLFIPEDLDSGVLVQVALDPTLSHVYEDLLKPQGWDVFLEAPEALGYDTAAPERTSFLEISQRASDRGQLAFGIEKNVANSGGGNRGGTGTGTTRLLLNPHKLSSYTLEQGDRVVVFGNARAGAGGNAGAAG